MIKYPVYLGDPHMRPGHNLVYPVLCGGDAMVVAEALEKEDAEAIVNALNALHAFTHPDGSTRGQMLNWFDKYIAPSIDIAWTNAFEGMDMKKHPEFNPPAKKE
jgi:hypothetical protein